ncbi:MAG: phage holin family protein [Patescibacteria group bacterium]|jgi:uncharacterized membrane protein YvlD (DUF360 family)
MGFYVRWLINATFLAIIFYLTPRVAFEGSASLVALVLVLGFINASTKRLLKSASVPTGLHFIALAALLGNGLLLWLASTAGWISIENYSGARFGLIVYWVIVLIVSISDNETSTSKKTIKRKKK